MLDRTDAQVEKERFTIYLPKVLTKQIRVRSAQTERTLSKYIADLVVADGHIEQLDMEKLRLTLRGMMFNEDAEISTEETDEIIESYIPTILSIFGIEGD